MITFQCDLSWYIRCHSERWGLELGVQFLLNGWVSGSQHCSVIGFQYAQCSIYHVCRCRKADLRLLEVILQNLARKRIKSNGSFLTWQEPDKCRPEYLINPLPLLYYTTATFVSGSDDFHLGVGVDGNHVVALRRLDPRFGVGLTVKIVLNEEVAPLFQVDAAVIAHEAVGVVELVPRLHDCATERRDERD